MANNSGRRDLFLQVSGNIDPFTQAMRAGKSALTQFGGDVEKQLKAIEDSFRQLGGANTENSARQLEAAYTRSFRAIRTAAEDALARPLTGAGALSLNVPAAREAVAAARSQAVAMGELATAAERLAVSNAQATNSEIAAAAAARARAAAADRNADVLQEELVYLERLQAELDQAGASAIRFDAANGRVRTGSGAAQAGLQQLSFQIGDVATQYAAGTPVLQIFAQQTSQVVQAVGLMSGSTTAFGRFMGGPWPQLIAAATIVLTPFVAKLFEGAEAADLAKAGSDGLADAQGALGKIFDLTSGKLERQNSLLLANARLTASNLRAEASQARVSSSKVLGEAASLDMLTMTNRLSLGRSGIGSRGLERRATRAQSNMENIVGGIRGGSISPETAIRLVETMDLTGLGVSREELQKAIIDLARAPELEEIAKGIDTALDTGSLPSVFRNSSRSRAAKPKSRLTEFRDDGRQSIEEQERRLNPFPGIQAGVESFNRDLLGQSIVKDLVPNTPDITLSPLDDYRAYLMSLTDDMDEALQDVVVGGLQSLEDGLAGIVSGTTSVEQAFKRMAQSIIADLARIAIRKGIISAIPGLGGFLGFADGGLVQSHADGGLISGPGTGRSDSILSWLSNGEFVMNAASTRRFLPALRAMNENRLPGFADGGLVGGLGSLRAADLSSRDIAALSRRGSRSAVDVRVGVEPSPLFDVKMVQTSAQVVGAAAPGIAEDAKNATLAELLRPQL